MSFHGGRTTACAGVPAMVRSISVICGTSMGVCSVSTTTKSKPAEPIASAVAGEPLESQVPMGVLPDTMARLNRLTGRSMRSSDELLVNATAHAIGSGIGAPILPPAGESGHNSVRPIGAGNEEERSR